MTRILLSAGVFVAMIVAVAFSNGAFINGIAAASDRAGMLVSIVPALALATLITRLRRSAGLLKKSGSLRPIAKARIAGWVAHAGVVLLLAAAIASRFTRTHTVTLGDAEIFRAKDQFGHQWQFSSQGVSTLQRENYASFTVSLLPERDEQRLGMISAEARSYGLASGSESGAPAFITGKLGGPFMETRLTIMAPDGKRPTLRVEFVPLATWVVVAAALVALGTLLSLVPPRDEGIA